MTQVTSTVRVEILTTLMCTVCLTLWWTPHHKPGVYSMQINGAAQDVYCLVGAGVLVRWVLCRVCEKLRRRYVGRVKN